MKRCPFCAEEIQDLAIICRFCNRDLPGADVTAVAPPAAPATLRSIDIDEVEFVGASQLWVRADGTTALARKGPDQQDFETVGWWRSSEVPVKRSDGVNPSSFTLGGDTIHALGDEARRELTAMCIAVTAPGSSAGVGHGPPASTGFAPPVPAQPMPGNTTLSPSAGLPILAVIFGAIGIGTTWMKWLGDGVDSLNGWDAKKITEFFDKFSYGPLMTVLMSGAVILLVLGLMAQYSSGGPSVGSSGRVWFGVCLIIVGLVQLGSVGAQYNAFDEAAREAEILVQAEFGMSLAALLAMAYVVLGIIALSVKSLIPTRSA